ncbi:nanos homolog 3 [Rhinatrema bivittatum]|uniref:nanos homolog 3 n=1 Tax=Rhinatrema bivittatum TaxID=194408 RepID=UPI00112B4B7F|nr:nanos homolog 3 [Rhinatrema bivittatum]
MAFKPPFDLWKDYLGLAALVHEMQDGEGKGAAPPPAPGKGDPGGPPTPAGAGASAVCSFCKHNGESRSVYAAHALKDEAGNVVCPILRQYVCPQCGVTGEKAHTRRFCPLTQKGYASVYKLRARNATGKRPHHHHQQQQQQQGTRARTPQQGGERGAANLGRGASDS